MEGFRRRLKGNWSPIRSGPGFALRLKSKLALTQLTAHTGLSTAMLSKIERGRLFPTLPTLVRIVMVFGVRLDHFFSQETQRPRVSVVRAGERLRLPVPPANGPPAYLLESLDYPAPDRRMESFYAEFPKNSRPSDPHQHGSAELVFIIDGELELTVGEKTLLLGKGDAAYFDSSVSHGCVPRSSSRRPERFARHRPPGGGAADLPGEWNKVLSEALFPRLACKATSLSANELRREGLDGHSWMEDFR